MAVMERRVRQLRLRARDARDVRHVVPVLEDALRCASLPDVGDRVLLVRRLALGPLARDVNAQALAQLIEHRVQQAPAHWAQGGSTAAATATQVCFDGALQARTTLALCLLEGQACQDWYWPLAVPEWRGAQGPADALRRIAQHIAGWPEARSALPAWAAALVEAGAAPQLAAAIGVALGQALLQQIGLTLETPAPGRATSADDTDDADGPTMHPHSNHPVGGTATAAGARSTDAPRWLQRLWQVAQWQGAAGSSHRQPQTVAAGHRPLPAEGAAPTAPRTPVRAPSPQRPGATKPAAGPPQPQRSATPSGQTELPTPAGQPLTRPDQDAALPMPAAASRGRAPAPTAHPAFQPFHRLADAPTACGGLLFLLPVLQRLGLAEWLDPQADGAFTRRVLRVALQRLQAPADDAIWTLVRAPEPVADVDAPPWSTPAPSRWTDPLLAAPRGGTAPAAALAACATAEQQAALWLALARRWLRRAGRIGLASLVRRPGRMSLTATHVDLVFPLADTDIRVRRLGLDIDPGWLPWFGRVVGFHYERDAP